MDRKMRKIETVLLDIDGVFTDNKVFVDAIGREFYQFNKRDGKGIQLLIESGVEVIAITSEMYHEGIEKRMEKLGVDYHYEVDDKLEYVSHDFDINFFSTCFMGDDIQDVPLLKAVGLAFCPLDAHPCVLQVSGIKTSTYKGGEGAVRDLSDFVRLLNKTIEEKNKEQENGEKTKN